MKNIAIIGSGTWGCALAIHLSKLGHNIKVWSFTDEEFKDININKECKFLKGIKLKDNIKSTLDFEDAINDSDYILHVTPSKFFRETIKKYKHLILNKPVIICSKGFEESSLLTLGEVFVEEVGNENYGVLYGPSHAEELAVEVPTTLVIASKKSFIRDDISEIFSNDNMKIFKTEDVIGTQIGGALKNIIAFASGITLSIGNVGDNTISALITRGLAEIANLGVAMGAKKETFYGLTGLGDIIATSMSKHSRNRQAGLLIGQGKSISKTKEEIGMIIESIDNINTAYLLAKKYNVEMPIVNAVYDILYNNLEPKMSLKNLMNYPIDTE